MSASPPLSRDRSRWPERLTALTSVLLFVVAVGHMTFVVPVFHRLLADVGATVSLPARMALSISRVGALLMLAWGVAVVTAVWRDRRTGGHAAGGVFSVTALLMALYLGGVMWVYIDAAVALPRPTRPGADDAALRAAMAGTWQVQAARETGDTVVGFRLTATADTTGWTLQFPGRPAIPVRVVARGGDSVMTEAAPYESVLRPGITVRTSSVFHFHDGLLAGMTVARYNVTGPDSVLRLHNVGTRAPE